MIIYIIGAGGHGKVVADIAEKLGKYKDIFFLDDNKKIGSYVLDFKVTNKVDFDYINLKKGVDVDFFVAIGDTFQRSQIFRKLIQLNVKIPTLVHPNSSISNYSKLGNGSLICAGSILGPDSCIGSGVIINHLCSIDHDCYVGDFVHICPNSSLTGNVKIDDFSTLGSGSKVLPGLKIGSNCLVGAHSLVTRDIPNNKKVFGIPAKIID